jgi:hypothetical protein
VLQLENESAADVTVYIVRGSTAIRLGTVAASSRAIFQLPEFAVVSEFVIQGRSITRTESYTSAPLQMQPGDRLFMKLTHMRDFAVMPSGRGWP